MEEQSKTTEAAILAIADNNSHDGLVKLQKFTALLNKDVDPAEIQPTPDGKANTLPISFIEMRLDELFFGQWSLSEPKYQREFNEIIGSAILKVIHPISGREICRVGFASVVITQTAETTLAQFNEHKKKNALDLTFPKLKAEILKNAAASLGKSFGRDINRKQKDKYTPLINKADLEYSLPRETFDKLRLSSSGATDDQFATILDIPMSQEQREELMSIRLNSIEISYPTTPQTIATTK